MKTVSIINLKGGVAKTITAANMAHILASVHNKRVLLVDNDKQGNTSKMYGVHNYDYPSMADILTERNINITEIILKSKYKNLDMVQANMRLLKANLKVLLDSTRPQQTRLKMALKQIEGEYDYCIIDNAPDINISTINALVASNDVIIPIKIDQFAVDGLEELRNQIYETQAELNPQLKYRGTLITQFQNNEVNIQGESWLRITANALPVFKTKIRKTPKVDESTFAAVPILEYSRRCSAAIDYQSFVEEYLNL